MPALLLDDVPPELLQRLENLARSRSHSPAVEAVHLLKKAVEEEEKVARAHVRALLDEIVRNRIVPPPGTPDSVEMLREDRNR